MTSFLTTSTWVSVSVEQYAAVTDLAHVLFKLHKNAQPQHEHHGCWDAGN